MTILYIEKECDSRVWKIPISNSSTALILKSEQEILQYIKERYTNPYIINPQNKDNDLIIKTDESQISQNISIWNPISKMESIKIPTLSTVIKHQINLDFVMYQHAILGFPVESNLLKAIRKGYLQNIPRLTPQLVYNNPIISENTAKGHLDLKRQRVKGNKKIFNYIDQLIEKDIIDEYEKDDAVIMKLEAVRDFSATNFSDLPGRLITSSHGNQYILISSYRNFTQAIPMKNRSSQSYIEAMDKTYQFLKSKGFKPQLQIMDNESSDELNKWFQFEDVQVQFVPPYSHRANYAESTIRNFKNHFISIIAGVHNNFPLNLWDDILEQTLITFNSLKPYAINPKISAYHGIYGQQYDFIRHPLAPIGTKVLCYESPPNRSSWASHGVDGFYIGPALSHEKCYKIYISNTKSLRITNTVAWFPHDVTMPGSDPTSLLHAAITDLTSNIKQWAHADNIDINKILLPITQSLIIYDHNSNIPLAVQRVLTNELVNSPNDTVKRVIINDNIPNGNDDISEPILTRSKSQRKKDNKKFAKNYLMIQKEIEHDLLNTAIQENQLLLQVNQINAVLQDDDSGKVLKFKDIIKGPEKDKWLKALADEYDRLIERTNTFTFIKPNMKPIHRRGSYGTFAPAIKIKNGIPLYRTRLVYGGNLSDYPFNKSAYVVETPTVKICLNAAVTEDAELASIDIENFYLHTPLDIKEYMKLRKDQIPQSVRDKYNLNDPSWWTDDECIWVELHQAIFGLPQAGILSQNILYTHLQKHGYHIINTASGLISNKSKTLFLCLLVDDFLIKYKKHEDIEELIKILQLRYPIEINYEVKKYLGLTIERDRINKSLSISIPNYVNNALKRLGVIKSIHDVHSPIPFHHHSYNNQPQIVTRDESEAASPDQIKWLQVMVGIFLYYARLIDPTMLHAINKIASQQSKATQNTIKLANHFLQYAATHPNGKTIYYASDMQLIAHSDASFNSETNARSRAAGYFFTKCLHDPTKVNGSISCLTTIIKLSVVASAFEAEYAALFLNAQHTIPIIATLEAFGYPQKPVILITDNEVAYGIANDTVNMHKSKTIDLRYHWIRDRVKQGQFIIQWEKGSTNLADYFTKSHPTKHYKDMRNTYISMFEQKLSKGCIDKVNKVMNSNSNYIHNIFISNYMSDNIYSLIEYYRNIQDETEAKTNENIHVEGAVGTDALTCPYED